MSLTSIQFTAIKADILASPDLAAHPNSPDGNFEIARLYNLPAAPEFWVWRTSVSKSELVNATSTDPDGLTTRTFNWTGSGFITRAQGERDAFMALFNGAGHVNPSLPQVRQAFLDIFSGNTAPAPSNRTHLQNIARRLATRLEKLLATGTGTAVAPATMGYEGLVSYRDIERARTS